MTEQTNSESQPRIELPTRPKSVTTAVKLLYVSFGIGVLGESIRLPVSIKEESPYISIVTSLILCYLGWLLIYKTARGRNWARLTGLVLTSLSLALMVIAPMLPIKMGLVELVFFVMCFVIDVVALVLLFQGPSEAWFQAMKAYKKSLALKSAAKPTQTLPLKSPVDYKHL